jgi:Cu2+-exporting ATPase
VAAILTAVIWPLLGRTELDFVLERVVAVLVIACPHALGLAIPLVSSISTAKAARSGILIRDRIAFEAVRNVNVVLFDKTGTLTTGQRGVIQTHITRRGALEDIDELIAVAAGLEGGSEHVIARAILAEAAKRKVKPLEVKDVMTTPGVGVSGRFGEYRLFAGGPSLLTSMRIDIEVQDLIAADAANSAGQTVIYVVRDTVLLGFVTLRDQVREASEEAVYQLQRMGMRVAMLTGDAHGVANALASELGIDEVYAEVLPHQKAEVVASLQAGGARVAMVGDGVNDAPALAQANVGIAIGTGTNVAVESAGVVLISDDPMAVLSAISLSRRSYAKMVQNLLWGAGYNVIAIPLAAGAFGGLVLSPAVGAVLMSLSTLIVAANAQLLRKDK